MNPLVAVLIVGVVAYALFLVTVFALVGGGKRH